ncbi:MAG TPA: preprotein translocase subunit SecY, partial [Xanthobacteraceae bacterium]|nr:preprotein translocase subunit SecY [Xanthobacteraceae bacterium]
MTGDVTQRIAVTIGALLLFRLGEWIPLPGVNAEAWAALTRGHGSGLVAFLGASSGGARRLAIFALGLVPYVSAAVLMQLATIFSGRLRARAREGESGRAAMVRYTRYLTVLLAAAQALGIANAVEHVSGVVTIPGALFIVSTVLTLTGGTLFLAWLAEQITARGIGNGIALVLFTGIVTEIPAALAYAIEVMRQYGTSNGQIAVVALIVVAVTAGVVAMELARRKLPVRYSARQIGLRKLDEQLSYLSLKLNPAGIVPVLLASFVMSLLVAIAGFFTGFDSSFVVKLRPIGPIYLILYVLLIIFCTFLYTASVLDPEESAEKLKLLGGRLEMIEPGEPTAAYLDHVVSRTALLGGIYLALV